VTVVSALPKVSRRPWTTGPQRIPQALLVQVAGPREPVEVGRTIALSASGQPPPFPRSLAVDTPGLGHAIEQLAVTRWGLWLGKLVAGSGVATVVEDRRWLRPGDAIVVGRTVLRLRELDLPESATGYSELPIAIDVLDASGSPARSIALSGHDIVVGCGEGSDVSLDDKHVSQRHCAIERRPTGVIVRDLESSNGTFVYVRPGDLIPFDALLVIGRSTYRVRRAAAPLPRRLRATNPPLRVPES
jgi:hypothetical protein